MRTTLTLIAATLAVGIAATPATAAPRATTATAARAFDAITATYRPTSDTYCIRSGWGMASWQAGRQIKANDCRTAAEWRRYSLAFDHTPAAPRTHRVDIAAR
jgi:hypothetical protein